MKIEQHKYNYHYKDLWQILFSLVKNCLPKSGTKEWAAYTQSFICALLNNSISWCQLKNNVKVVTRSDIIYIILIFLQCILNKLTGLTILYSVQNPANDLWLTSFACVDLEGLFLVYKGPVESSASGHHLGSVWCHGRGHCRVLLSGRWLGNCFYDDLWLFCPCSWVWFTATYRQKNKSWYNTLFFIS